MPSCRGLPARPPGLLLQLLHWGTHVLTPSLTPPLPWNSFSAAHTARTSSVHPLMQVPPLPMVVKQICPSQPVRARAAFQAMASATLGGSCARCCASDRSLHGWQLSSVWRLVPWRGPWCALPWAPVAPVGPFRAPPHNPAYANCAVSRHPKESTVEAEEVVRGRSLEVCDLGGGRRRRW